MPFVAALVLAHAQTQRQTVPLKLVRAGVTQMSGGYMNRTIQLSSTKPSGLTRLPAGLSKPLYGVLQLSGVRFLVVLAYKGSQQVLLVDSNSNGDMQDDARPIWSPRSENRLATGIAEVRIPFSGHRASCSVILIQSAPKTLTAIADYGFSGKLSLGNRNVPFLLLDASGSGFENGSPAGSTLAFDRLSGRKRTGADEQYPGDKPFTINGDSFLLSSVSLSRGEATFTPGEKVPERPMPLLLEPGALVPSFTVLGPDAKPINFPADYKTRTVLVYAWSTVSAPSLQWLPRVKNLYDSNRGKGLEVLGICLDRSSDSGAAMAKAAQMPWPTCFDGKSWRGDAAKALGVEALPFLLLVDGSNGKIIATMSEMIGDGLEKAVASTSHP